MSLPYKINPVKATCMKCDNEGGCGIHSYNDTCFNICAAYTGTSDPYAVDEECAKACSNMIEQKRHEFYGVGYCDHQQPYRPVIWENSPPYFVNLLNKGLSPEKALAESKKLCEQRSSSIASDCIQRQTDYYNALENYGESQDAPQIMRRNPQPVVRRSVSQKQSSSTHWTVFILVFLLIAVGIYIHLTGR